jgi:hypothetical protein
MTAEIKRIGRWTSQSALEEAAKVVQVGDPLIIVSIGKEDGMMKYWAADATNMQVNWMADNIKADVLFGGWHE